MLGDVVDEFDDGVEVGVAPSAQGASSGGLRKVVYFEAFASSVLERCVGHIDDPWLEELVVVIIVCGQPHCISHLIGCGRRHLRKWVATNDVASGVIVADAG
jgi:hypothetical protein